MTKCVQHKSGQGEKFVLLDTYEHSYEVRSLHSNIPSYCIPKSEYILCDPPDEWEDVTREFHATDTWPSGKCSKSNGIANNEAEMLWIPSDIHQDWNLRLRKIGGNAAPYFIIERLKK